MSKESGKDGASRRNVFMMDPADLVIIGHDTDDGVEHPLCDRASNALSDDEDMARNVQVYGVIEPITCKTEGERTIVVDGRTRVRAARLAAKWQRKAGEVEVRVPVWFKRGEDRYLFGISRSANAHRRVESPLTNAANAQRMLDLGSSEAEVANAFGVRPASIRTWVNLLTLAPKVRNAVDRGEVGIEAAGALAKLAKDDQLAHLEQLRAEGVKPTARNVVNKVRTSLGKSARVTPKDRLESAVEVLRGLVVELSEIASYNHDEIEGALEKAVDRIAVITLDKRLTELIDEHRATTEALTKVEP